MKTTLWTSCPTQTARGKRVGVASRLTRLFAPTNANWSATTCRCVRVGGRYEHDTIRDHWGECRGVRVSDNHRYAHRVLGDLH